MSLSRFAVCVSLVALVAALAVPAGADSIKLTNGLVYQPVTIETFGAGWLGFKMNDRLVNKKLTVVAQITIDGADDFNAAEAARAGGSADEARRLYAKAAKSTDKPYLAALITARLAAATTATPPKSETPPPTPTTKPAPSPEPAPTPSAPVDPLSCPEALAQVLYQEPTHDSDLQLTSLQREELEKTFRDRLRKWRAKNSPIGKEVTWVLRVDDVTRDEVTRELVLTAMSEFGLPVEARWSDEHKDVLTKVSKEDVVVVTGKVTRWKKISSTFKLVAHEASFALKGKSIKPAGEYLLGGGPAYGARYAVFVLDRSGSMLASFDLLREQVLRAINKLGPRQSFHIVFFAKGIEEENPPKKLIGATAKNKAKAREFLLTVSPRGGSPTDPLMAIKRGFDVLAKAPGKKGKVMFLLSDGDFRDNEEARQRIASWNKGKKVRVNTIFFASFARGKIVGKLKQIAAENGGTFVHSKTE